jgi:hypothetical protein
MSFRNLVRVLTVAAALTGTAALPARALPHAERVSAPQGLFSVFYDGLRSFWMELWGEEGTSVDPHGSSTGSGMRNVSGEEGMTIDPSGKPTAPAPDPGVTGDEGMSIDPNG